jgi:hypothetical protein
MAKITKAQVKKLLETASDLDDLVYALQGTNYEYILNDAGYDFDQIIYAIQDL